MIRFTKLMLLGLACTVAALAVESPTAPAPEIDGSSAATAVALVAGGVMILRSRMRK